MEQLRYADEVRSIEDVPIEKIEVKKNEIDLAVQLIQQQAGAEFEPEKYEDNVKKRILEQIQRKVAGQGDHRRADRGAEDADHRSDGSAQGEPRQGQGPGGAERKPAKRVEAAEKPAKGRQVKRKAASA